jgi:hypothetical protein
MYHQIPLPLSNNTDKTKTDADLEWDTQLLKNASKLEVIHRITGTPVEETLTAAIELARTNDRKNIPEIRKLLIDVQKYMYEYGLN